ncbi:MAG: kynureninase [Chitinophagaceae bacterium]|nr:kynureninase [Chitinophagaceae bacterium]
MMKFENTLEFAKKTDKENPLISYRNDFYIPVLNDKETIYFAGNGIGLQPKGVQDYVLDELENWASYGFVGMDSGHNPWVDFYKKFSQRLAPILGALPDEIVVMDQLTANLHFLLASFYRPETGRKKIIIDWKAFPSAVYAIQSQMQMAGVTLEENLIEVDPREDEHYSRSEDIIEAIEKAGNELAMVVLSGVNYYSGHVLDIKSITDAAHKVGAYSGWDLAHAVGNIPMQLHDWNVDFAVWCSYKYLNGGPGAIGGLYVHEKHYSGGKPLPRLAGLFGSDVKAGYQFKEDFIPLKGAAGWQLSMPPVLSLAVLSASLELFESAGFENLVAGGRDLSGYLVFILKGILNSTQAKPFEFVTSLKDENHGCQISINLGPDGKHKLDMLRNNRILITGFADHTVRIAPVPLYNTFEEVFLFGKILEHILIAH